MLCAVVFYPGRINTKIVRLVICGSGIHPVFLFCAWVFMNFPHLFSMLYYFYHLKKKLSFKVLTLSLTGPDLFQKLRPLSRQRTFRFWGEERGTSKSCPKGGCFPCAAATPVSLRTNLIAIAPAPVTHPSLHLHLGILLASERQSEGRERRQPRWATEGGWRPHTGGLSVDPSLYPAPPPPRAVPSLLVSPGIQAVFVF